MTQLEDNQEMTQLKQQIAELTNLIQKCQTATTTNIARLEDSLS